MSAADFGTLFLDSSLHIKRFTDRVTELFNIRSADEGRPIMDFAHQLEYEDLIEDARAVLSQLAPIRREIRSRKNRWYDVSVRPYRTADGKIDGVVVTFIDITERRRTENSLRQQKQLVELSSAPIFVWDFDGGILEWNRGSEVLYGYSREEALGRNKPELLATVVPGSSFAELKATLLRHGRWSGELKHRTKDGRQLTGESRLELASFDDRRLVLESTNDITERKLGEERQQLMIKELNHRVRNILAVVQAIARYTLRSEQSKEEFAESFGARLSALATCHTLLAESDWKGTDLEALVRAQLSPYTSERPNSLQVLAQKVVLPADLASSLGLVLHELATNAAKYGALSRPRGTIHVNWSLGPRDHQQILSLTWRETGGPRVKEPSHTGFGTELIDRVLPGASIKRTFGKDGLVCTIEAPVPEAARTLPSDLEPLIVTSERNQ